MRRNHEVRTYTISPSVRLCAPCGAERKLQKGITAEMAIYHLSMKIISRSNGYSAVASGDDFHAEMINRHFCRNAFLQFSFSPAGRTQSNRR